MVTEESAESGLADLVAGYVAEQCGVLIDTVEPLRRREPVVHGSRVAVRRLRSTVRVFDDLFEPADAQQLDAELVWWAGLLGRVRDLDILGKRLSAALDALPPELVVGPVESALDRELAGRRRDGWEKIHEALDAERFAALLELVRRWRDDPPFTATAGAPVDELEPYVNRAGKKLTKRMTAARQAYAEDDPEASALVHRARKAGKRHRYAAELAEPEWGKRARKLVKRRKHLQDVLGEHQDAVVCAEFLRDFGIRVGARKGHNGFSYGLLYARQREELAQMPSQLESLMS
jgi:CHAD domain-containing protein